MSDMSFIKGVVKQMIRDGEIGVVLKVDNYGFDYDHKVEDASDVKSVLGDCDVELRVVD